MKKRTKKKQSLKIVFTIITIIIMIPVILATLMWFILSKSLTGKILLLPIKLIFIMPIIKWGIFIILILWTIYAIINRFSKIKETSKIQKI